MKTELVTSHPSSPLTIEWVDKRLVFHGWISMNPQEAIELRNFLNQLELPPA